MEVRRQHVERSPGGTRRSTISVGRHLARACCSRNRVTECIAATAAERGDLILAQTVPPGSRETRSAPTSTAGPLLDSCASAPSHSHPPSRVRTATRRESRAPSQQSRHGVAAAGQLRLPASASGATHRNERLLQRREWHLHLNDLGECCGRAESPVSIRTGREQPPWSEAEDFAASDASPHHAQAAQRLPGHATTGATPRR